MILYILKTIICAALFLGVYYVLLEKEKMLRFNRAYLLLAAALSFCIPLISFTTEIKVFPVLDEMMTVQPEMIFTGSSPVPPPVTHVDPGPMLLAGIYFIVTGFLLLRFGVNIYRIIRLVRNSPKLQYGSARLVLVNEHCAPYSFLCYIFLNRDEYGNNTIEPEVYHHEMEHVQQKHSADIILMELAMAFLWFNPLLYLYRKAIQLNHEFLADEAVVRSFRNPVAYQVLLLNKISLPGGLAISSSFNYKVTKKRLVMITKHTTKKVSLIKAMIVVPVIGAAVFIFSTRTVAQSSAPESAPAFTKPAMSEANPADTTPKKPQLTWLGEMAGGTKEGVSAEMLKEYQDITGKYLDGTNPGHEEPKVSEEDRVRLEKIFKQMSRQQQLQQRIFFGAPLKPLAKKMPTVEQMKAFADPAVYGVWIDNKKVSNEALVAYKNTDISSYMISNLYGAAKKGKKYKYQLNVMTTDYFTKYNDDLAKNPSHPMLIRWHEPAK